MCIHLFNPPAPGCQPVEGPRGGQPCGLCTCVPPYYQVDAGGEPGADYAGSFLGKHILQRDLQAYVTDDQQPCQWDCPIAIPGLLVNLDSYRPAGWSLYFLEGSGFNSGWIVRAAGQSYVGDIPPQDVAFYTLQAPGQPQTPFNCLSPTTFWMDSNYGSPQALSILPQSITIQPFWA